MEERQWGAPNYGWDTQTSPEPVRPTYGLSSRPDIPPARGLNFAVYDPVSRQRVPNVDRNCTAQGCCVPKCFAEKGNRVSYPIQHAKYKVTIINYEYFV